MPQGVRRIVGDREVAQVWELRPLAEAARRTGGTVGKSAGRVSEEPSNGTCHRERNQDGLAPYAGRRTPAARLPRGALGRAATGSETKRCGSLSPGWCRHPPSRAPRLHRSARTRVLRSESRPERTPATNSSGLRASRKPRQRAPLATSRNAMSAARAALGLPTRNERAPARRPNSASRSPLRFATSAHSNALASNSRSNSLPRS